MISLPLERKPCTVLVRMLGPILLCMCSALGCARDWPDNRASVRDSAGVIIVESRHAAWPEGHGWRVADDPLLDIGSSEGSPEYQFHRVEGALRLQDGRVVVADAGSSEIRFFDQAGRFLHATGREGDAPGEFRMIAALGPGPGDSLWVFDYGNRRFTVLTHDGATARTVSMGGFLSAVGAIGRFPDGSFVVQEGWGSPRNVVGEGGLRRDPVVVAKFSPDGSVCDTIGVFPGREVYVSVEDGRGVMSTPLFAHNTSAALRGQELFVGDQASMDIGLYSAAGLPQRVFRVTGIDLRLSGRDIDSRKREVLAELPPAQRQRAGKHLDEMEAPDSRPAYGRLVVGTDGSLWAAEHTRWPTAPAKWTVFGRDGRLLGEVSMPQRFTVFQIGPDWVLGVGQDELDVEHVRLYRLEG